MIFGNKERILYGNRFNGTNGNGYQPIKREQTNEECMRTCSTEELATVIYGIAMYDTLYDRIHNAFVLNPCEDDSAGINEVIKWLKEKHNGV